MLLVEHFDIFLVKKILKKYIMFLFCKMGEKGPHYSEIICVCGVRFTTVLKCTVTAISNVQVTKV